MFSLLNNPADLIGSAGLFLIFELGLGLMNFQPVRQQDRLSSIVVFFAGE